MVNKPTSIPKNQHGRDKLIEFAFIAFLVIAFVGLTPFAAREALQDIVDTAGEVDILRQVITISISLLIIFSGLRGQSRSLVEIIGIPVLLILAWSAITLFWSPVPWIGLRRLALAGVVIATIFVAVDAMGVGRALHLFAFALLGFVMVSLASGMIVTNAVHQADDFEASVAGAWRGVFAHKNQAGFIAATQIIMAYYFWQIQKNRIWLLAIISGILLVLLSHSKTPFGLLIPAVLAGILLSRLTLHPSRGSLFAVAALLFAFSLIVVGAIVSDDLFALLQNPDSFTGRAEIWMALLSLIHDHLLFGVGYGSLYSVSIYTPLLDYAPSWVLMLTQGHNGYLDIIATLGLAGFSLFIFVFLANPMSRLLQIKRANIHMLGMLYSLLIFVFLHNLLESSFLDKAQIPWVVLLIVFAGVRNLSRCTTSVIK
ncbi:MAG: O-antigen ligase family protein [Sideroxydans sp.]|nr:O-antigen ligase family protein [Sideroxydans sp.]